MSKRNFLINSFNHGVSGAVTRFFPLYYRKKVSAYQYGTSRASGGVFGGYKWLNKRLALIF